MSISSEQSLKSFRSSPKWEEPSRQEAEQNEAILGSGSPAFECVREESPSGLALEERPPAYRSIPGVVPQYQGRSNNLPPSYEEVVNPNAPPPAYQALFGSKRADFAGKEPASLLEWLLLSLLGLGLALFSLSVILLPFLMLLLGLSYYAECPCAQIPLLLILGGLIWAARNAIYCYHKRQELYCPPSQPEDNLTGPKLASLVLNALFKCLLISWFLAFLLTILKSKPEFSNTSSSNYCNQTVYTFSIRLVCLTALICIIYVCSICLIRFVSLGQPAATARAGGATSGPRSLELA